MGPGPRYQAAVRKDHMKSPLSLPHFPRPNARPWPARHLLRQMVDREGLYRHLPIGMQNMVCSIEGLRIQRSRFGPSFAQLLREVERRSQGTRDEIRDYRNQRLHNYVQLCGCYVPFYRKWFARNKLDPQDIQTLDDLRALAGFLQNSAFKIMFLSSSSTAIPERAPSLDSYKRYDRRWASLCEHGPRRSRAVGGVVALSTLARSQFRYLVRLSRGPDRSTRNSGSTRHSGDTTSRETAAPQRISHESSKSALVH